MLDRWFYPSFEQLGPEIFHKLCHLPINYMTQGFHGPWNFKSPGKESKKIITCSTELKTSFTHSKTPAHWILQEVDVFVCFSYSFE